jgi:hypothetical protein
MEKPLAALDLPISILQFVEYGLNLVTPTAEAAGSVPLANTVYLRLFNLNRDMVLAFENAPSEARSAIQSWDTITRDSWKLLQAAETFRAQERSAENKKSFGGTLRAMWRNPEVAWLEFRLKHTSGEMKQIIKGLMMYVDTANIQQ